MGTSEGDIHNSVRLTYVTKNKSSLLHRKHAEEEALGR